jgi:solute carrier family 25 (mitochondrial adenine nucleotide translocator), member 4/5/6/31
MTAREKPRLSLAESFTLGGVADVLFKTATAPIERVKLILQSQAEMLKQGTITRPYAGVIDCTVRTFKSEGFRAFFRGNLASCIRYFPAEAMNFAFKDKIKVMFRQHENDPFMVNFAKNICSGGIAGTLTLSVVYSLDYARTRLANDVKSSINGVGERKYNGLIDVYRKTLATDGIAGLYRGFLTSCAGIFIYRGIYFGVFDSLKSILPSSNDNIFSALLLAYGTTLSAHFLSYPIDTIRRRMMMTSGQVVKYQGPLDCLSQIIRNEGAAALYKGFSVFIVRSIVGAQILVGFDKFIRLYIIIKHLSNR